MGVARDKMKGRVRFSFTYILAAVVSLQLAFVQGHDRERSRCANTFAIGDEAREELPSSCRHTV